MGVFSKLFDGSKKPVESNRPISPEYEKIDFEDEHGEEVDRLYSRAGKAGCTNSPDPSVKVRYREREIALYKELEKYCVAHGAGGESYFKEHYAEEIADAERDLLEYLENDYASEKSRYDEWLLKKKQYASIKKKTLELLSVDCGIARKELYGHFDSELHSLVLKAMNELVNEGRIKKEKIEGRLLFFGVGPNE